MAMHLSTDTQVVSSGNRHPCVMTNTASSNNTPAFFLQAIIAFGIALAVVVIGEVYLPVPPWTRAFLAIGTLFLVSATFTLAKCVRDQQETDSVVSRIDRARIEKMLADYDPYRAPTLPNTEPAAQPPTAQPAQYAAPDSQYLPNSYTHSM